MTTSKSSAKRGLRTEARRRITEQQPDLIFMDIEMPGGNGIDLIQELGEPLPYVIFVTAHPEFALPAFELQAVDYLVKPVERKRFAGSVLRAKRRICRATRCGTRDAARRCRRNEWRESTRQLGAAPRRRLRAIRTR